MTTAGPQEADLLNVLLASLRRAFAAGTNHAHEIAAEIDGVSQRIARVTAPPLPLRPTGHPLIRHLATVLDLATEIAPEIATALRPLAWRLPWRYGYAPRADAPELESAMGWAEIVGPAAPFVSNEVGFGLTLLGPRVYYPPHRHPAVELYRIVVGRPHWTVGAATSIHGPGEAILHHSDVVHAMRTEKEPLLAIYSWTGDVESPSVWA
jgi:hypothetical protein